MNKKIETLSLLLCVSVFLPSMASAQDETLDDPRKEIIPAGVQLEIRPGPVLFYDPAYHEHDKDDVETKLMKEKIRAALLEIEEKRKRVENGQDPIFYFLEAENLLIPALLEFHKEPAIVISILEKNLEVATRIETNRRQRLETGMDRPDDHAQAIYFRADAELQLLRAKNKNK